MATLIIGLKEFRQKLSEYSAKIQTGKYRIIVLNKNKPVMDINPITKDEFILEDFLDIQTARKQVKAGEVSSLEETRKELGL